jgi:ATP-dependent DNA helicase RecG
MSQQSHWDSPVMYLKKVGPVRAEVLNAEVHIKTFRDLLHYFPYKYIDRTKVHRIREINPTLQHVTLIGKITELEVVKGFKGAARLNATFSDGTGSVDLVWFKGVKWLRESLKIGEEIVLFGKPTFYKDRVQIPHPEIDTGGDKDKVLNNLKIVPYYSSTEKLKQAGLESRGFRALIYQMLTEGELHLHEFLPHDVVRDYKLMGRREALWEIHFPKSWERLDAARRRLKFEELFLFQLSLAKKKLVELPAHRSKPFPTVGHYFNTFYEKHLPFTLTEAQKRVLREVRRDLAKPVQMNRLVQGDVGSGKTMVAFMTMLIALDNGFQACMMAPTEILAEQHYRNILRYSEPLGIGVALFTGSQKKAVRTQLLRELAEGHALIAVGTHALIEEPVKFKNLGLAIVDEQHKFGVRQRAALWEKAEQYPHNMVMTATPIPRTLALTLYGDVDVSVIDELPPGRSPIITSVKGEGDRLWVFGFVRRQLEMGRQAYFVYPLVEESEKVDWLAVTEGYEALRRTFQGYHVGIVHGRMKAEDKEFEMQRFKKGETHLLVATTVIEVGVDVPNATVMVIENAEKFGLSQLHQLRGRVGRGGNQSFCILMSGGKASQEARKRLKAMAETTDGFKIAEFDLQLRGPGDFLGTRQSGLPEFKLANILEDGEVLNQAREAAFAVTARDPQLLAAEHSALLDAFKRYLKAQEGLGDVA